MTGIRQFGRYEVRRELGRGGMATVYLGYDPTIKRQVAIKVLPRQFTFDPQFRTRFNREAQLVAALEHYAIVPIYDFGEHDDQPFIVMRLMPGGSLDQRLEDGPVTFEQALHLIDRLSAALDRAHAQGVIHRDLKPANILFDADGEAYLSDFGIAKLAEATASLTGSGIIGTPAYMSPEQVQGDDELDGRTDVYSLGLILFEILTGRRAYEAETPIQLALKQITEPLPNILELRPGLPAEMQAVMDRALAKTREDRYPTPRELSRHLNSIEWQAQGASPPRRELEAATAATTLPPEAGNQTPETDRGLEAPPPERPETIERAVPRRPAFKLPGRIPRWLFATGGVVVIAAVFVVLRLNAWPLASGTGGRSATSGPTELVPVASETAAGGSGTLSLSPTPQVSPTAAASPLPSATPLPTSVADWQELAVLVREESPATRLAWSADGARLASVSDLSVIFWDTAAGLPLQVFPLEPLRTLVEWSPRLNVFAKASGAWGVEVYNGLTGEQLFEVDSAYADLAWSPDESRLAVSARTLDVYDGASGSGFLHLPSQTNLVSWTPDGGRLISVFNFTVTLWDGTTGEVLDKGQGECDHFLIPSPDGRRFACGGEQIIPGEGGGRIVRDSNVQIWTVEPLENSMTLVGHTQPVRSVAWAHDSRYLASVSEDGTLRVWDVRLGETFRIRNDQLGLAAWSPNGRNLASVDTDGSLTVWELTSGNVLLSLPGASGPAAWSPDGSRLAWGAQDGSIRIWGAN